MQYVLDKKQTEEENLKNNYTKLLEALDLIKLNYVNDIVVKQSSSANFTHLIENDLMPVFEKCKNVIGRNEGNELMQSLRRIKDISALIEEKEGFKRKFEAERKYDEISFDKGFDSKVFDKRNKNGSSVVINSQISVNNSVRDMVGNRANESVVRESALDQLALNTDSTDNIHKKFLNSHINKQSDPKPSIQSRYNLFNIIHCDSTPADIYNLKADDFSHPNDMILLSEMKAVKDSKAYFEQTGSSDDEETPVKEPTKRLSFSKVTDLNTLVGSDAKKIYFKGLVQSVVQKSKKGTEYKQVRSNSVIRAKETSTTSVVFNRNKSTVKIDTVDNKPLKPKLITTNITKSKIKIESTRNKPNPKPATEKLRTLTPKIKNLKKPKVATNPKPKKLKPQAKELTFAKNNKNANGFVLVDSQLPQIEKKLIESSFFHDSIMKSSKRTEQETDSKTHHNLSLNTKKSKSDQVSMPKLNIQILKNSNSKIRIKEGVNDKNEKCIVIDVSSDIEDGQEIVLHSDSFSINTLIKNTEKSMRGSDQFKRSGK